MVGKKPLPALFLFLNQLLLYFIVYPDIVIECAALVFKIDTYSKK